MLSSLWWLPMAVAAAAVVPLWRGARRLVEEAAALRGSISELSQVRPLVAQVNDEIAVVDATRRGIRDIGPR